MKTFFVSSTFKDMQYERDAIHEITLPKLNLLAKPYGQTVSFCDLRWGVNTLDLEEEEGMRKVMKVCLDEIDRCKPPLIVILGDCYGTIVKPEELVKATAEYKNFNLDDFELSATAIEIIYGALTDKRKDEKTLFYFRDIENAPPAYYAEDSFHREKLKELKDAIIKTAVNPARHYSVKWQNGEPTGVKEFAQRLADDIFELMRPEWETVLALTPFERERALQWNYIKEKGDFFRGRSELLNTYIKKIENGEKLIFIKGDTGSGKSTLFSSLALKLKDDGWNVLPFIGGLTSESNDALDIIRHTVYYFEKELNLNHFSEEKNIENSELKVHTLEDWQAKLAELCYLYDKSGKKIIIMLDAVERLFDDDARNKLRFIPENLSQNVRFLITANESFETVGISYSVIKNLEEGEVQDVIEGILSRHNRQLDKYVIEEIKHKKEASNPLYLTLLVQRLLMMDKDDFFAIRKTGSDMRAISDYQRELISSCPCDIQSLCAKIINEAAERINPHTVNLAMQYIACSRFGLRQEDLASLLKNEWDALDFANFISYLSDSFIMRDDGRFDFSHISIREGILNLCDDKNRMNCDIFHYLCTLEESDAVRQAEIIYHAIKADEKEFFVQYIGENYRGDALEAEEGCLSESAKCIYDTALEDKGEWLCKVIDEAPLDENTVKFVKFISTVILPMMSQRQSDMILGAAIQKRVCALTQRLVEKNISGSVLVDIVAKISNANYVIVTDVKNKASVIENAVVEGIKNIRELLNSEKTKEVYKVLSRFYLLAYDMYLSMGDRKHVLLAIDFAREAFAFSAEYGEKYPEANQCILLAKAYICLNDGKALPEALNYLNKASALVRENDVKLRINISFVFGMYYFAKGGIENLKLALSEYEKSICVAHSEYSRKGDIGMLITEIECRNNYIKALMESGSRANMEIALNQSDINVKLATRLKEDLGTASVMRLLIMIIANTASIYQMMGGDEAMVKAAEYYKEAIDLSCQIVEMVDTPYTKLDIVNMRLLNIKNLFWSSPESSHEEILNITKETLELSESVCKQLKDSVQADMVCALCHNMLGIIYNNSSLYREALAEYEHAVQLLEKYSECSGLHEFENALAQIYNNYGMTCTTIKAVNEDIVTKLELNMSKNAVEEWLLQVISECKDKVVILSDWLHLLPDDVSDDEDEEFDEEEEEALEEDSEENGPDFDASDPAAFLSFLSDWTKRVDAMENEANKLRDSAFERIKSSAPNEAIVYYKKALDIAKRQADELQTIGSYSLLALCDVNVGTTYSLIERFDEALPYLLEGVNLAEKVVETNHTLSAMVDLCRYKARLLAVYVEMDEYNAEACKLVRELISELNSLKRDWDLESLDLTFYEVYLCALSMCDNNPDLFDNAEIYDIYCNVLDRYKISVQTTGSAIMEYAALLGDFIEFLKGNEPQYEEEVYERLNELLNLLREQNEENLPILTGTHNNALDTMIEIYKRKGLQDSQEYLSLLLEKSDIADRLTDMSDIIAEQCFDEEDEEVDIEDLSAIISLNLINESMLAQYEAFNHPLCEKNRKLEIAEGLLIKANILKDVDGLEHPAQEIYDEMINLVSSTEDGKLLIELMNGIS